MTVESVSTAIKIGVSEGVVLTVTVREDLSVGKISAVGVVRAITIAIKGNCVSMVVVKPMLVGPILTANLGRFVLELGPLVWTAVVGILTARTAKFAALTSVWTLSLSARAIANVSGDRFARRGAVLMVVGLQTIVLEASSVRRISVSRSLV